MGKPAPVFLPAIERTNMKTLIHKEYGYALSHKIAMLTIGVFFISMSIVSGVNFAKEGNISSIILISTPGILLGFILGISSYRRKVIIGDDYIEKRNFRQVVIPYEDVEKIKVFCDEMRVIGKGKTIHISKDLEDYKQLIELLVTRFMSIPHIPIEGNPSVRY